MNRGGPMFTNVMFADDIMLFSKACNQDVLAFNKCLETFCSWSGQLVNQNKSGLIFSKLVPLNQKRRLKAELQMNKVQENASYLGAPLFASGKRLRDFNFLQEKLEAHLKGWRSKNLSWASCHTLIKSVVLALPTYTFSTFDVPVGICNKLDAATRRFWWNPKKDKGGFIAWKAWEQLCRPKIHGGLGFSTAKKFNEALLAKLTWFVASKRVSPCIAALRSKYKVKDDWLKADPCKYASNFWKAIERLKSLINKGACFLVGDGASIDVWKEPWVPWLHNFTPIPKSESFLNIPLKVADLIDEDTRRWNLAVLIELFDANSVGAILKIVLPHTPKPDKLIWVLNSKGNFTVQSALQASLVPCVVDPGITWKALWKLNMHDRLKIFIWRVASGILPTKMNLVQKLGVGNSLCPLCLNADESLDHLFFKCSISRAIWFSSYWAIRSDLLSLSSCQEVLHFICNPLSSISAIPGGNLASNPHFYPTGSNFRVHLELKKQSLF
jgi:hypothetical protein